MSTALTERVSMRRTTVSLDEDSLDWLATQYDTDRISMSERLRALVSLARTDSAIAERAIQRADELRRAKRGGE